MLQAVDASSGQWPMRRALRLKADRSGQGARGIKRVDACVLPPDFASRIAHWNVLECNVLECNVLECFRMF